MVLYRLSYLNGNWAFVIVTRRKAAIQANKRFIFVLNVGYLVSRGGQYYLTGEFAGFFGFISCADFL